MNIMLTGASGFIGSHLKLPLSKLGVVYELKSDLRNYKAVNEEIQHVKPDLIVHLAARTEVQLSFYEQLSFNEINYLGTVNIIESCRSLEKMPFLLFASTMEVFGWQPISDEVKISKIPTKFLAFNESTPVNPNAPYAVAKYACEKYLQYAERAYGLPWAAIRQTNSYGRKDNDFFVTEQIISQMLKSDIVNLGYAEPYRNFIFIDDLLDAWLSIIENKERCAGEIFTVGPDDPRKIRDCVDFIAKKLNWSGEINWDTKPKRQGEIFWLNSSSEKIYDYTGWKPKYTYDQGINKTIEIWKEKLNVK